jgi:hypothetical protein
MLIVSMTLIGKNPIEIRGNQYNIIKLLGTLAAAFGGGLFADGLTPSEHIYISSDARGRRSRGRGRGANFGPSQRETDRTVHRSRSALRTSGRLSADSPLWQVTGSSRRGTDGGCASTGFVVQSAQPAVLSDHDCRPAAMNEIRRVRPSAAGGSSSPCCVSPPFSQNCREPLMRPERDACSARSS